MKNKIIAISLIITMCIVMTGCVSDKQYEDLEKRVSYLEKVVGVADQSSSSNTTNSSSTNSTSKDKNSDYLSAEAIELHYDFDPQSNGTYGKYYQLRMGKDKCTLTYYEPGQNNVYCDFSKETYNELLNMVCSQELEKFESSSDANGKIVYERQPYILGLYMDGSNGIVYFKNPKNIDQIIAKFESLRDSAKQ